MPGAEKLVRPNVLVLAAGGILGEAWMTGVLAGIEDAAGFDLTQVDALVGTSAGAIAAANLAGGRHPRRPAGERASSRSPRPDRSPPPRPGGWPGVAAVPLASVAPLVLAAGAPAGALLRAALLSRVPAGRRSLSDLRRSVAALRTRFDGRLRVVCVEQSRGRRVVFGSPGAPASEVADAVIASCSIPGVFAPVEIGGRRYVDGGVWSLTNLDVAPVQSGANVLCLNPTGGLQIDRRSPFAALRAAARATAAVEGLVLRRRGAQVRTVMPDPDSASLMALNLMDPGPAADVLAAGFSQGRSLAS
jgi:NTE family protein